MVFLMCVLFSVICTHLRAHPMMTFCIFAASRSRQSINAEVRHTPNHFITCRAFSIERTGSMVLYSLNSQGQQQLLLLQQRYAMMEHHLQQQQQKSPSPASPPNMKEEQNLRSRQINCVYFTEAKPAAFSIGVNPETAALCTLSSNLPTLRNSVSVSTSGTASSASPTVPTPSSGNAVIRTPPPTTTTRTSFMISDILDHDSPSSRRNARTCSSASSNAPEDGCSGRGFGNYCDDASNGRDSPRSVVSDDVEGKERDHREDSIGSDSDVERSGQAGK